MFDMTVDNDNDTHCGVERGGRYSQRQRLLNGYLSTSYIVNRSYIITCYLQLKVQSKSQSRINKDSTVDSE